MLNHRGGIEADLTVTRLEQDRFRIDHRNGVGEPRSGVAPQAARRSRRCARSATSRRASRASACGDRGRARSCQPLVDDDLSNDGVPLPDGPRDHRGRRPVPRAPRDLRGRARAGSSTRRSSSARRSGTRCSEAGTDVGLVPAGYRAIDSLRLEKGYRAWGSDITPDDTPLEAGLGFAVAFDKDFLGRDALERASADGVAAALACLMLADPRSIDARQRAGVRGTTGSCRG